MPRLLFDFKCEEGHISDTLVDTKIKEVECPECGNTAKRQPSVAHFPIRLGVDSSMPTMALKWEKMQRAKNSGKMSDSNNTAEE